MIKLYDEPGECCPDLNADEWDDKEITWKDKLFVKTHVNNFFYMPPNFGDIMARVRDENAFDTKPFILSEKKSLWGTDVYIPVSRELPGTSTVKISGKFLSKVFSGSLKNTEKWKEEMENYVKSKGKKIKKMYLFHNACPDCKKVLAQGYTAILAEIEDIAASV